MRKALTYALCLLKFRPRSEYELRQRLKNKGFDAASISEAFVFLKQNSLVNDLEFARIWVESRIKRPLGIRRIEQELKSKGVDRHLIAQAIESAAAKYDQEQMLKDLLQRRWEKLKNIEPRKAKRRLFLYLLHRGFCPDMIQEAISQI